VAMGHCLYSSREYVEAAQLFLAAASLVEDNDRARNLVRAAKAFRLSKRYEEGKTAAYEAASNSFGEVKREAVGELYELLKENDQHYFAFSIAEFAIHENPQLPLRFDLALDYRHHDLNELGLYHFKLMSERANPHSSWLHNLALLYADCKLLMSSVEHYKKSFALGETLSAANLGFMYLDCGMAEEAKSVCQKAMKIEPHEGNVEQCLSQIVQRTELEKEKEVEIIETSNKTRDFLVSMGQGLQVAPPVIGGPWKFPFGEMTIESDQKKIAGNSEVTTEEKKTGLGTLFGDSSPQVKTVKYALSGEFTGAVCSFELTSTDVLPEKISRLSILAGGGNRSRSGFIVFASDGKAAAYVEVAGRKLGKLEKAEKLSQRSLAKSQSPHGPIWHSPTSHDAGPWAVISVRAGNPFFDC